MTSSSGTFSAWLALCARNSPMTGEFPSQRPVTRSFDVFSDLRMNKWWVNNHEAGELRRHQAHYDVTVMWRWVFYGAMNQVISSHSIELVLWKHLGVGAKRVDIEICITKLEGGWWDSPQERLHNFIYDYFESTCTEIIQYTSNVF